MQSIVLTGISANDPTPGVYEEINFAVGPASGSGSVDQALLIGNFLTGNLGVANTVYGPDTTVPCNSETDVINICGAGSELHRGYLKFVATNGQASTVYLLLVTESVGAKASLTFTLAGVPTKSATWRIYINDEFVEYSFVSGDTLASITAGMVTAANANSRWPCVAAQATVGGANDSVTFTAKQKGPRGNFLNGQALLTNGVNTTTTNTSRANFAGGTTADSNTAALAAVANALFYYQASAAEDASQYGAVVTQINSMALPLTGYRQRCFAGAVDSTLSNVNTIATGLNAARAELDWQKGGDWTPFEIACHNMGIYAALEAPTPPRNNYSGFPSSSTDSSLWKIKGPRSATAPSAAEIKSALLNGVTPIGRYATGAAYLVKRITTRSLNGSVNDYRIRDAHKVTICDKFGAAAYTKTKLNFGGKDLMDNPKEGSPPVGSTQVMTPRLWDDSLKLLVDQFGADGMLQNIEQTKAGMKAQRETNPPSRTSIVIALQPIDVADEFLIRIDQVA